MEEFKNPTESEVRSVMNEVYNVWFAKYKHASTDTDFQNAMREAHKINAKYPFKLCQALLLELIEIIGEYYKGRGKSNEQSKE